MLEQYALLQKNQNTGKLGVAGAAPTPDAAEQGYSSYDITIIVLIVNCC